MQQHTSHNATKRWTTFLLAGCSLGTVPLPLLAENAANDETSIATAPAPFAEVGANRHASSFSILSDSIPMDSTITEGKEKRRFMPKLVDYFRNSNKQRPDKKVDFGFIPGPNYSETTGLGLGFLGTATYSADRSDPPFLGQMLQSIAT